MPQALSFIQVPLPVCQVKENVTHVAKCGHGGSDSVNSANLVHLDSAQ